MTGVAVIVYILCAATALVCSALLGRAYRSSGVRLLLWSSLCFAGLFLNNLLLIVDVMTPTLDLAIVRQLPALAGIGCLLYGLVWESGR